MTKDHNSMTLDQRIKACQEATEETLQQINNLQNRYQQLIGYKQALADVLGDQENKEESIGMEMAVESIAPSKSKKTAA